jgi:hypothetical protein
MLFGAVASWLHAIPAGRGDVSLGLSAIGTYDSNIGGNRNAPEDFSATTTPQIGYTRRAGDIEADASASLAFVRFNEQRQYDADNAQLAAGLKLSDTTFQKLSASVRGTYSETSDVNADLNARLKSATTSFTGQSAWVATSRMDLGLTGGYTQSDNSGASNVETITAGGTYGYHDFLYDNTLLAAYNFQATRSSSANIRGAALDQTSHVLTLGLGRPLYRDVYGRASAGYRFLERSAAETAAGQTQQSGLVLDASIDGPFLPRKYFPKVTSHARIFYDDATMPGINDTGTKQLGADVSIVWEAGPASTWSLLATRSQRLSVTDFTVLSTDVSLTLAQKLRYNLTGSLAATHSWESFRGLAREDRRRSLRADLAYQFAVHWHAALTYQFESVLSSVRLSAYERHLVTLTLGWQL